MQNKNVSRILHIDDDESNRYAVNLILKKAGYEVVAAENGAKGIKMASTEDPDLIILDIRLPDMNGYDICRNFKANPELKGIPVLQTSATFTTSEDKVEGLDSGADGYLAQPIESAVLVATVRSLLRTRHAEKIALKATLAREETLAIVSHDLRNPLAAILLQVSLLSKQIATGSSDNNIPDKLAKITNSCNRMNRLIGDLLDVSNIEGGQFKLNKSLHSLNDILNEVWVSFEDQGKQVDVSIVREFASKIISFEVDKDRIIQVLGNIISNSLKFTPKMGKITMWLRETDTDVLIGIEDTGKGIEDESLKHIFDRYWQGHKTRQSGVGLGLSIVKGIVEAHDGKVIVESEIGKGTRFTVVLPKPVLPH
ncbi:MAG TPA: hybrid sensor histidine kinase/response regulator [Bacteriovoracaceae bacterium]|nr:hybrid sensor histidine kinase/response regulator [Bacteriovoracaceae bacterium]